MPTMAPVINWMSLALTTDGAAYFVKYWFDQMPWDDYEAYWRRSPLSLVGNVTTPTLLMTGEDDFRTPMAETEQYLDSERSMARWTFFSSRSPRSR